MNQVQNPNARPEDKQFLELRIWSLIGGWSLVLGILLSPGIWSLGFAAEANSPGAATVQKALTNMRRLHSFEYRLFMQSTGIPEVHGEFTGRVFLPDTEERTGSWQGVDGTLPVRLMMRGETGYSLEDSAWTAQTRDNENDFLVQLERALSLDSFRAPQKKGKYLLVAFVPNLPFLDPIRTRQVSGTIRIRRDRMLIEQVSAASPDSSLRWQTDLSGFDKAAPIAFPFVRQWCASLTPDPRPPTPDFKDTLTLRDRFRLAGYEAQFDYGGGALDIYLEREIRDDLLGLLTSHGSLLLGLGRLADAREPKPDGFRRIPLAADSTQTTILERTIAFPDAWADLTAIDSLAEPAVALSLTRSGQAKLAELVKLENSGSNWLLVLDDRVVAFAPIAHRAHPARLVLSVSGNSLLARHLAIFSRTGPLGSIYRLSSVDRVR